MKLISHLGGDTEVTVTRALHDGLRARELNLG